MASMTDRSPGVSNSLGEVESTTDWLELLGAGWVGDLRQALRQMVRNRSLSVAMITTLALCIGITTAIFSIVYSLLLKPLPFHQPTQLVELYNSAPKLGLNNMPSNVVQYLDYKKSATSYTSVALWAPFTSLIGEDGGAEPVRGARVTFEFFQLLSVNPELGDFFSQEQSSLLDDKGVVLAHSFWEKHFASDPHIIGKSIRLDGETLRVVGVAPRIVESFDARIKFYRLLVWPQEAENPIGRYSLSIHLFGRLKGGLSVEQAAAEAALIEKRYYDQAPVSVRQFVERSGIKVEVYGVQAGRVSQVRNSLLLLQGCVLFVLVIGCVNVANLLLIRVNARRSELAIRAALGAGRSLIARLLIVESLALTGLGTALGVFLAWGALKVANVYAVGFVPYAPPISLDLRVLAFAVLITVLVGIGIGIVPVVHILRENLAAAMQRSSRSASSSVGIRSVSSALVILQIAVALMLLAGAGLLVRSFANALRIDAGFDPKQIVTARIVLPGAYRSLDESARVLRQRLLQALKEIPGVTDAGLGLAIPFRGGLGINTLSLAEDPLPPGSPQPGAYRVFVTPGYMNTVKLRIIEGRYLDESDMASDKRSYVVDESFAKKFFPNRSAIGARFAFGDRPTSDSDWGTVVGVVRDVPHNGVEDRSGNPFVYQVINFPTGGYTLFVRTTRSLSGLGAELRSRIHLVDPTIPVFDIKYLQTSVDESFDNRRGVMLLLAAFALLALFLAALGVYSVLAYDVSQRTREIGVRSALGATRSQIVVMVLKQGVGRTLAGLAVGLLGAALLSRYMTTLLYDVGPIDFVAYAAVSILLLGAAALASYLPARRAAHIDPVHALAAD